jgi:hypothetical protein
VSITEETRKAIRAGIESEAYNKGREVWTTSSQSIFTLTVVHNLKSLCLRKNFEHPIFMDYGTTAGLNSITAGQGYLEVLELSMQILLLGQLDSVLTVSSQWGRRIQFLY